MPVCIHILKDAQLECTGISRIVTGLAKHARSFGYEASVLFLGEGPLVRAMNDLGIPATAIRWSAHRRDIIGAWRVWRWLKQNPAEIAHVHHGGFTVRALCRMAGVSAVVQHIHGRIIESNADSISNLNLRSTDAVIACSNAVARCLPQCRGEVIYAGVDTGSQPPASATSEGPLKLGILGRLIPLKNVEALIIAASHLAAKGIDVQVEIAGSGPSEPSLRNLVTRLGLTDRVRFLGWRVDVGQLLASWTILVIPSLEEGFGLSALEAMAAAIPVVACRVGGLPELVVDGVTGRLVPPGDIDELTRCLAHLANNRQQLTLMGNEGWKRAHVFFSAARMAQQTSQVYDELLRRP